jgi:predicted aspartyl protease
MSQKIYQLQRRGRLMTLKAYVAGKDGIYQGVRLLVDTGATYTVLPASFLRELGYDVLAESHQTAKIVTASETLDVPLVSIQCLSCLGISSYKFPVVALNLPANQALNGLLGMDFLTECGAIIDTRKGEITIPDVVN